MTVVRSRRVAVPALLTIAASMCVAAPSNSVSIRPARNASGSRPFSISRVFAAGEIPRFAQARVEGTPVETQCDVKTRWPDGSVQHAIVSFAAPLSGRKTATVDFVDQASGNNDGFLDRAGMLAVNWGARIEVSGPSTLAADARDILSAWTENAGDARVTYWLRGRICTQVILEDRSPSLAYDLGWDESRPLHPIFVATFYPAFPQGVKVEMVLENMWSGKLRDQTYSLTLRTGNPPGDPVYTRDSFTHYARTRWRKVFWSGVEPARVETDFNLAYLAYSGVIPNYDLSKEVSRAAIAADIALFRKGDRGDINGSGLWTKYMPQTGGREDIGLFPAWYMRYLYTFDAGEAEVFRGNAAVSGHVPIHYRESDPKSCFQSGRGVSGFGRPVSIDAHPSGLPAPAAPLSNAHGWTPQNAHHGGFVYLPYVLSGDWYYLEELYFWASWILSLGDPTDDYFGRHGNWGILPYAGETRGVAWGLRDLAEAAFLAPDGSAEKAYYREKLDNNIAIREGEQNITDGAFYDPAPGSKWHWGRYTAGEGLTNPTRLLNRGDEYASLDEMNTAPGSEYRVKWPDGPWQYNYFHIVLGHINELGFPVRRLQAVYLTNLLNQILNPDYNPYLTGAYRIPVRRASTNGYYQSWAELKAAYSTAERKPWSRTPVNLQTYQGWPENDENDIGHGYPHIAKAAASFLPGIRDGALDGAAAWQWMATHVRQPSEGVTDVRWMIVPREGSSVQTNAARRRR